MIENSASDTWLPACCYYFPFFSLKQFIKLWTKVSHLTEFLIHKISLPKINSFASAYMRAYNYGAVSSSKKFIHVDTMKGVQKLRDDWYSWHCNLVHQSKITWKFNWVNFTHFNNCDKCFEAVGSSSSSRIKCTNWLLICAIKNMHPYCIYAILWLLMNIKRNSPLGLNRAHKWGDEHAIFRNINEIKAALCGI